MWVVWVHVDLWVHLHTEDEAVFRAWQLHGQRDRERQADAMKCVVLPAVLQLGLEADERARASAGAGSGGVCVQASASAALCWLSWAHDDGLPSYLSHAEHLKLLEEGVADALSEQRQWLQHQPGRAHLHFMDSPRFGTS